MRPLGALPGLVPLLLAAIPGLVPLVFAASCATPEPGVCSDVLAAAAADVTQDAGSKDAGTKDAGSKDAGGKDAATKDAGANDDASTGDDAGTDDGGSDDAGSDDPGAQDGGSTKDAGTTKDGGAKDAGTSEPNEGVCGACGTPSTCGVVRSTAITTASGIAASAVHDRLFYVHNGGLELPRFYAVDAGGNDRGSFTLQVPSLGSTGLADIAVGPCGTKSCVFVADTADATESRKTYAIYRTTEPTALGAGDQRITPDVLSFTYPDGSHDAQALLVHPRTGVITLVTRDRSGGDVVRIYDLPVVQPGSTITATFRKQIVPGAFSALRAGVTGADVRAGHGILLRTPASVLFYPMDASQSVADAIAAEASPCELPVAKESDGNAIAWLRSGQGYVTIDRTASPVLHYVICEGP
ncbi:Hypothetical protein A7982_11544 [Minicystis rosea]|nr:Hypothetical protein A7982_11544 [Minicystis rosea]